MKKFGFTLAEVLIVIAIIGVVSVLVLPTLHENYQKKLYATSLKKNYTMLMEAFRKAMNDENTEDFYTTELGEAIHSESDSDFEKAMKKSFDKFSIVPTFSVSYKYRTGNGIYRTYINGSTYRMVNFPSATIYFTKSYNNNSVSVNWQDGYYNQTQKSSGSFHIDVNGADKGPNRVGMDLFSFDMWPDLNVDRTESKYKSQCTSNTSNMPFDCFIKVMDDNWEIKYY